MSAAFVWQVTAYESRNNLFLKGCTNYFRSGVPPPPTDYLRPVEGNDCTATCNKYGEDAVTRGARSPLCFTKPVGTWPGGTQLTMPAGNNADGGCYVWPTGSTDPDCPVKSGYSCVCWPRSRPALQWRPTTASGRSPCTVDFKVAGVKICRTALEQGQPPWLGYFESEADTDCTVRRSFSGTCDIVSGPADWLCEK